MAYFRITHKEIRIRINKFALLTKPGDFDFKKTEWAIIYLARKNNLKIKFSEILKKLLSAYKENTLNGEKSIEIMHISVNFRTS